jgi:hypothetical protein
MADRNVVNPELYDFLKDHETGLYTREFHKNKTVFAYVHIPFYALSDFAEIIGGYYFDEGGMEARMFRDTICVEINDIIDGKGHRLSAYKNCFDEYDWDRYKDEIAEMEADHD